MRNGKLLDLRNLLKVTQLGSSESLFSENAFWTEGLKITWSGKKQRNMRKYQVTRNFTGQSEHHFKLHSFYLKRNNCWSIKWSKNSPFNKWCWKIWTAICKKNETRPPTYTTHKIKFKMDKRFKYKSWNHKSPRGEHWQENLRHSMQKHFILLKSHLFILSLMSLALRDISVEILLGGISENFLPMFSSRSFMLLWLIFNSFIHLDIFLFMV